MEVASLAERVLRANWRTGERDGVPFAYTRPSPRRYPHQWYWDSCFAAICRSRFDPAEARLELESLLSASRDDGFIGHTIFWEGRPAAVQRARYNVRRRDDQMTSTIQPPLLAWAWQMVVGDPALEPRIGRHLDWLAAQRALDGDGLLWILQPDESGLDSSPKFDPVWGRRAHGRAGFLALLARNRRLGFDLRTVLAAGGPVVCEVVTNVLWGLSLLAAGRESVTPALVERLWDEKRGVFRDRARGAGGAEALVPFVETWSALAPLALPDLPDPIAQRLAEGLCDPQRFWTPMPPPSVAVGERSFRRGESRGPIRRYWRGPSWVNAAWLLWLGLERIGRDAEASELARRVRETVEREGLREYYDPFSGRGLGAPDFAWSALAAELE